jgi:hypothetical protein
MDLISLEEFETYSGKHDNEDMLIQIINAAEAIVINFLGFNPKFSAYTDTISGNGRDTLSLYRKNISNITELIIDGKEIDVSLVSVCGCKNECIYYADKFPTGHGNIKISYSAGYETIPAEIKMAVLRITSLLEMESNGNIGITSKSFGDDGSRTYIHTIDYTPYLQPVSGYKVLGL